MKLETNAARTLRTRSYARIRCNKTLTCTETLTRTHCSYVRQRVVCPELDMDWIHPWIGLDWIGSEVFFDKFVM